MMHSMRFKLNARMMQVFNSIKNREKTIVSITEFGTWSMFSCVAGDNTNIVIRITLDDRKETASVEMFNGSTSIVETMDDDTIKKYASMFDSILETVN